jgi:heavy metal sensor kinase
VSRAPIRIRVAGAFAIAMAAVFVATGWFLYSRLDAHLQATVNRNLRLRAEDLAALVQQPGSPLAAAGGGRIVEEEESYAQLIAPNGTVLDATRPPGRRAIIDRAELRSALEAPTYASRATAPGFDHPSRLLATAITQRGRRVVLVVGTTTQDRLTTLADLRTELYVAGPVALLLATLAGYALAGLSLRPVESMRRRAAAISAETPGERLPTPRTRDEIERLGATLNDMLARLEQALDRERDLVADAGHELRTPLALLRTELELALRHAGTFDELREAVQRSLGEVERLGMLADDLLLIARSDRGKLELQLQSVPAKDVLATVASRFEWRAQEAGRPVRVLPGPEIRVRADRIRLEQALGNLVDNALRHGSGEVRLRSARLDGLVELHVTDEGGGIPPAFLAQAFDRFSRGDSSRHGSGSGLGLSIVAVIAAAHGGSAHVANREEGGTDAWLALPV